MRSKIQEEHGFIMWLLIRVWWAIDAIIWIVGLVTIVSIIAAAVAGNLTISTKNNIIIWPESKKQQIPDSRTTIENLPVLDRS